MILVVCLIGSAGRESTQAQSASESLQRRYYVTRINDTIVGEELVTFYRAPNSQLIINSFMRFPYGLIHRCVERQLVCETTNDSIKEYRRTEQLGDVNFSSTFYEWDKRWWWVSSELPFLPYYNSSIDTAKITTVFDPESVALLQNLINIYRTRGNGTQVHTCIWEGDLTEITIQQESAPLGKLWLRLEGPQKIFLDLAPDSYEIMKVTIESNPMVINQVEQLLPMTVQSESTLPAGVVRNPIEYTAKDGVRIAGELYLPQLEGPFPVIVMVGEGPYGARMGGLFESIATELAIGSQVATLLLNQRGLGGSNGNFGENAIEDLVTDTEYAFNFLKQTREVDSARMVVAGYGLGGYVAMVVAAENPLLRGCILIASPAEPYLPDLAVLRQKELAQQEGWSEEKLSSAIQRVQDQVELIGEISGNWVKLGGKPFPLQFSRSCLEFSPLKHLRSMYMPVLVMHGTLDRAVPKSQAEILAKTLIESGNKNVTLELLPRLDHWIGKPTAIVTSYPSPISVRVDPEVMKPLTRWIAKYIRG